MPPADRVLYQRAVAGPRAALGTAGFAAEQAAGAALPLEATITRALVGRGVATDCRRAIWYNCDERPARRVEPAGI